MKKHGFMNEFNIIDTNKLKRKLDRKEAIIIDIRPVDAYNGWKMQNEKRGGHIKGAKNFHSKWIDYIDWIEITRNKNILTSDELVFYGYDEENIHKVAKTFQKAGYQNIHLYYDFVVEWSTDASLPMEYLPRFQQLVPPVWLNNALEKKKNTVNNDPVVCHCHYRNIGDYHNGHIPGAIPLDTNLLEDEITWNRRTSKELENALLKLGISQNTTVVVYGRFSFPDNNNPYPGSSAGHLGAIRCAFLMMYAGVKDVKILNGGIQSWLDEGYQLTKEETKPFPAKDFGINIPANPRLVVDTPGAKEILADKNANLVSVRSWPEFIGEVSGYNYIIKTGRIPGAVFGNCGTDAYHMENYRNLDHTMREAQEVEALWAEVGITPNKRNAFYCGTGWRGSEAFMNAYMMGWDNMALYDGGWFEWSNDPSNPYVTGEPNH